jgi:hypothetical protein
MFRILGSLEVEREGRSVALGETQQRALLALLLIHANQRVSVDRLVTELRGCADARARAQVDRAAAEGTRRALTVSRRWDFCFEYPHWLIGGPVC